MKLKERLKHKYALSDQGVNDMIKGFVSVTILDLVLMLLLIRDYLQGNLSGRGWFYGVGIIVCLALVAVTTYIQYNATFLATYVESGVRRITLAEKLPDGYQTMIGENGCELSGGERQRISIARAFLKDAPIILLDEATASLDVDNETMIQEALSRLLQNKTVLIIAHRLRTVADDDKIVVLKDGVVAETGTPEQLMKQQGIYQHMTQVQNEAAAWKW